MMKSFNKILESITPTKKLNKSIGYLLDIIGNKRLDKSDIIGDGHVSWGSVDNLMNNKLFKSVLDDESLVMEEPIDLRDAQTFCSSEIIILPIRSRRESDLAPVPYAILISEEREGKLSDAIPFAVMGSWSLFLESLYSASIKVTADNGDYGIYNSDDGGKSWKLVPISKETKGNLPDIIEGEYLDIQKDKGREVEVHEAD